MVVSSKQVLPTPTEPVGILLVPEPGYMKDWHWLSSPEERHLLHVHMDRAGS